MLYETEFKKPVLERNILGSPKDVFEPNPKLFDDKLAKKFSQVDGFPIKRANLLDELVFSSDIKFAKAAQALINLTLHQNLEEDSKLNHANFIERKLLAFGGKMAEIDSECKYKDHLNLRGQLWLNYDTSFLFSDPAFAIRNLVHYWIDANDLSRNSCAMAQGYALYSDGVWRPEVWCLDKSNGSVKLIDPTRNKKIAYFGFVMEYHETRAFVNTLDVYL